MSMSIIALWAHNRVEEDGRQILSYDLVTTGHINTINSNILKKIKEAFCKISSSSSIKSNWWTEFSSWEDFRALLRTGTRLSIHTVVARDLDCLNKVDADIENY